MSDMDRVVAPQGDERRIARRELIRRSVAAGSLVWAAPAITGLSRAAAQQSPAPGGGGGPGDIGAGTGTACAGSSLTTSPGTVQTALESGGRFLLTQRAEAECFRFCEGRVCASGFRCRGRITGGVSCTLHAPSAQPYICTTPGMQCECICFPV